MKATTHLAIRCAERSIPAVFVAQALAAPDFSGPAHGGRRWASRALVVGACRRWVTVIHAGDVVITTFEGTGLGCRLERVS